jgi:hypothetical protein
MLTQQYRSSAFYLVRPELHKEDRTRVEAGVEGRPIIKKTKPQLSENQFHG